MREAARFLSVPRGLGVNGHDAEFRNRLDAELGVDAVPLESPSTIVARGRAAARRRNRRRITALGGLCIVTAALGIPPLLGANTKHIPSTGGDRAADAPRTAKPPTRDLATVQLATGSPDYDAHLYFGRFRSLVDTLSGQVTLGVDGSQLAASPGLCVSTVVVTGRMETGTTGAVYAAGLGRGWNAAEGAPPRAVSRNGDSGVLHQQVVSPPPTITVGRAWSIGATVETAGDETLTQRQQLALLDRRGTSTTWTLGSQRVACELPRG